MPDTVFPYDDDVVDPYSADDTKNPHEETVSEDAEEEAPPKRRPGRPKKTT
jgi:hypothetical protein